MELLGRERLSGSSRRIKSYKGKEKKILRIEKLKTSSSVVSKE